MNTNWAKILLFSLIGSVLGFLVCKVSFSGNAECDRNSMCTSNSACGHGNEGKENCCKRGLGAHQRNDEDHSEHPGDAEAERIVSDLEKMNFNGDTTIAIEGGKVRVVRDPENISVHVDMIGKESIEKEIEIKKTL